MARQRYDPRFADIIEAVLARWPHALEFDPGAQAFTIAVVPRGAPRDLRSHFPVFDRDLIARARDAIRARAPDQSHYEAEDAVLLLAPLA